MRDLIRSLHLTGRPVPVPWPSLGGFIRPRGGYLMLVLGAGGVGKSAVALAWALRLGAPALYVSLDTSLVDHAVRVIAMMTGRTVEQVQDRHDDDPKAWAFRWGRELEILDIPLRFTETTSTVREIRQVVAAETEYWGVAPAVTVVDNLSNLLEKEEGPGEYRRIMGELHQVAKEFDTLVMALHHLRKKPPKNTRKDTDEDEGTTPVRLSDALFAVDKDAQIVLGLWRPRLDRMAVAVLKNRMGPADRNAGMHSTLRADLGRMQITESWIKEESKDGSTGSLGY